MYHNTEHNSANKTLNENDINLELSKLNETRTMNVLLEDHKKEMIQYERNPMYPGQIFFVESPSQIGLMEEGDRVNDEDRDSDEEDSFSSSSDDLLEGNAGGNVDENIDV